MGIAWNVRWVTDDNLPKNLEGFYQEIDWSQTLQLTAHSEPVLKGDSRVGGRALGGHIGCLGPPRYAGTNEVAAVRQGFETTSGTMLRWKLNDGVQRRAEGSFLRRIELQILLPANVN